MTDMLPFTSAQPPSNPIFNTQEIPKELDIFYRNEADFLPKGKKFEDLTPAEKKKLRSQYRFSPFRPGIYQGITGMGSMVG